MAKLNCGLEYVIIQDAAMAVEILNKIKIDGRIVSLDLDYGFEPSRKFGRDQQGGQVRDEIKFKIGGEKDEDRPIRRDPNNSRGYENRKGTD